MRSKQWDMEANLASELPEQRRPAQYVFASRSRTRDLECRTPSGLMHSTRSLRPNQRVQALAWLFVEVSSTRTGERSAPRIMLQAPERQSLSSCPQLTR